MYIAHTKGELPERFLDTSATDNRTREKPMNRDALVGAGLFSVVVSMSAICLARFLILSFDLIANK